MRKQETLVIGKFLNCWLSNTYSFLYRKCGCVVTRAAHLPHIVQIELLLNRIIIHLLSYVKIAEYISENTQCQESEYELQSRHTWTE